MDTHYNDTLPLQQKRNPSALSLIGLGILCSVGLEWVQHIPIIGTMRFPYRMCLLVFIGIAYILSELTDRKKIFVVSNRSDGVFGFITDRSNHPNKPSDIPTIHPTNYGPY